MDSSYLERLSFIQSWLSTVDSGNGIASKKRRRSSTSSNRHVQPFPVMSTPPASSSSQRQLSPGKKRKLAQRGRPIHGPGLGPPNTNIGSSESPQLERDAANDDIDEADDVDQTPRSNVRFQNIFTDRPRLPPHTPSLSSQSVASSRRSTSPVKNMRELDALDKPILTEDMVDDATGQLNEDVRGLYTRLYEITVEHDAFLPRAAQNQIRAATGRHYKDSWFRESGVGVDDVPAALGELAALIKLVAVAKECVGLNRSEAAWNTLVHDRILELALAHHGDVRREQITTAQIAKPFVPCMNGHAKADLVGSKMVDFAMVLSLDDRVRHQQQPDVTITDTKPNSNADSLDQLARCIQQQVWASEVVSVNQTVYQPLQYSPIAVAIETKVARPAPEGRVQLAVWAAAWHERMHQFLAQRGVQRRGEPYRPIVSLPLVLVTEHEWKLSFACDRGERIDIVGEMHIGGTKTLTEIYKLVACLRELADWVQGPFRVWLTSVFVQDGLYR